MTGRVCAAKCLGYTEAIRKYFDLICCGAIESDEAIAEFNKMNEKNEARFTAWRVKYVDPLE